MKKFLISLMIVSLIGLNTVAFASVEGQVVENTEEQTVDAGITPDSILYSADKLFEDLQLAFTTNSEKEAELLLKFAQERLTEAKEMTEEEKTEFVKTAMEDYIEILDKAEDKVIEVVTDEGTSEEVKEDLSQELEDASEVDENLEENLDEEQQEELEEKTTEVSYTANVVRNLDPEIVKVLRDTGMGFGNIAHTVALSELSGKSVEEIATMIGEGKGIGNIAKELGIHPSNMNKKLEVVEEVEDEEVIDEDTTGEEVAEELDENTNDEGETQTTAIQTVKASQNTAKQVQSTSIKATSKKEDNKTVAESKNEKPSDNKEVTSIQQKDSTVEDNTQDEDEDGKNEIKKEGNQNNSMGKTDIKEKGDNKSKIKSTKGNNGKK